jgi:hypothetical protein
MTEAQEEAEEREQKERDRKVLEQCCEEAMSWVVADLAAENEKKFGTPRLWQQA